MKNKIIVIMCFLLLTAPIVSFAKDKKEPKLPLSASEYAHDNAVLKRSENRYYDKAHRAARRAKWRAKKKAEIEERKSDEQTGSDAQINVQF